MIYCVMPRPLDDELYMQFIDYYRDDDNVIVIVDRRRAERRAPGSRAYRETVERRVIRDRRRARVPGDLLSLATP
jgi:hypothetical protein